MSRGRVAVAIAAGLLAASGGLAIASSLQRPTARVANASSMTVMLRFLQTNPGRQQGQATLGVKGRGTFSAKLAGRARDLALLAQAAGIPFGGIARGGSFTTDMTLGASGTNTGSVFVHFADSALGSACFRFTARGGQFQQGDSFVPTSGTMTLVGGTGEAAHWQASAPFALKTVGGTQAAETFTFTGTAHGTISPHSQSVPAACK